MGFCARLDKPAAQKAIAYAGKYTEHGNKLRFFVNARLEINLQAIKLRLMNQAKFNQFLLEAGFTRRSIAARTFTSGRGKTAIYARAKYILMTKKGYILPVPPLVLNCQLNPSARSGVTMK